MPTLQGAWNALLGKPSAGIETKAAAPPMVPPPQVQSLVWSPGSYPDAAGDYWNPLLSTGSGSTGTWNSAVFACLKLLAQAFQEAPLRVYRAQADGTEEWLDEHPLMDLLADAHPSLSQRELDFWLIFCLHSAGNAYLRKIRNRAGQVVQLWPISPATMTPETTEEDRQRGVFISHYVLDDGKGKHEELAPEDVVHFRLGVDDADHRLGLSPLRRLLREVASDEEATRFLEDLLNNFAVNSLAVTVPPGPVLTEEQAKQIRDRLREDYGGASRNRGHVAVVANGATLSQVGFSPQQLDLKQAHYHPETRICAVLGVPPTLANFASGLEHSIFNNVRQGQEHFYEQTVNPLWRQVAATYTKQLLRVDFEADRAIRLKFDTTEVRALQEDTNEVYARISVAVEKGWMTKDEARAEVGLDPLPDGLGEAQDPMELLRQQAEISGPPAAPGGRPGAQNGAAPAAKALEQKAAFPGVNAIPAMQDVLTALSAPLVQADLEAYLREQHERVVSAVTQAGLREG